MAKMAPLFKIRVGLGGDLRVQIIEFDDGEIEGGASRCKAYDFGTPPTLRVFWIQAPEGGVAVVVWGNYLTPKKWGGRIRGIPIFRESPGQLTGQEDRPQSPQIWGI